MIVAAVGEQGRGKETSAVFNITENALGQLISSSGNLKDKRRKLRRIYHSICRRICCPWEVGANLFLWASANEV